MSHCDASAPQDELNRLNMSFLAIKPQIKQLPLFGNRTRNAAATPNLPAMRCVITDQLAATRFLFNINHPSATECVSDEFVTAKWAIDCKWKKHVCFGVSAQGDRSISRCTALAYLLTYYSLSFGEQYEIRLRNATALVIVWSGCNLSVACFGWTVHPRAACKCGHVIVSYL